MRYVSTLVLLAACGPQQQPAGPPAPAPTGATASTSATLPTEPAEAQPILDDLNRWCAAQQDECAVSEQRDDYPGRVASGETNGWILSHRERLRKLGVEVVWDRNRFRFVSEVEDDLRLIVGGQFSPDHLGPGPYQTILARAKAPPALYLGVLVERVVGPAPDAGWLSSSYVPFAVELLREGAPAEARTAARRLLPLHEAALRASTPPPASDEYRAVRLKERVEALRRLAG